MQRQKRHSTSCASQPVAPKRGGTGQSGGQLGKNCCSTRPILPGRHKLPGVTQRRGPRRSLAASYNATFSFAAISPTTPRRNSITQATKITPCVTVTQEPNGLR
jgi:hypothetical protein